MNDSQQWASARYTEHIPNIGVSLETYIRVIAYKNKHNLKLSETLRKAVVLFFLSQDFEDFEIESAKREITEAKAEKVGRKAAPKKKTRK